MPSLISLHSTKNPRDVELILQDINGKNCFKKDETILIKPNYVTDDPWDSGVTVDPAIVATTVHFLQSNGFNNIIVAEGGMEHYDMAHVFKKVGLKDALQPYGIVPVDLNNDDTVEVIIDGASALRKVTVAKTYLDVDAIISISKLKVHSLAGVTLCMKNMMGGLRPKNIMHSRIHEKIVDLNRRFKPDLSIIDAIIGNKTHETICSPAGFNTLIGGTDVVAVDSIGANMLGYDPFTIEYLVRARNAGLGECNLDNVKIVGNRN